MSICFQSHNISEVGVGKDTDEFHLDIKDPEIVAIDKASGNLTALKEGETIVSLHNLPQKAITA